MPRQRPIKPEQPRSEPEIIPPARGRTQAHQAGPAWFAANGRGTNRIFMARLGPWSIIGIVLLIGLFTGAVLAILLGALLIAIPVVGLLVAGALIANVLRARLRR
jgi:predicted exporter